MSVWGWFKNIFGSGALNNPDKGTQSSNPPPEPMPINVTDERAMQVSTVFACVRLIVQSGGTLPLGFYQRVPDGRIPLDEDHYLPQLLKYAPNNFMTGKEFRQAMLMSRVLWGNGYARIRWSGKRPVALIPLKPEQMEVIRGENGLIYRYSTSDGVTEYGQKDIFHLKGWGDGVTGLSVLGYARQALGLSVQADRSATNSIGGRTNAVLELDDYPTDEQKARLRDMYGSGKDTVEFNNNLAIIPGGMKYRAISIPPDDLQLLQSRQWQVTEICRFFGIPSVMVDGQGSSTAAWPASYEQQVLSFLTFTLKGYIEEFEDAITAALLSPSERKNTIIEHKVDGLLRTDSASRASYWSMALQNGWMTRNEVRIKENLPPMEGADELTAQINLAPVGELDRENANVEQN